MNEDLRQYYETILDLFTHPGWALLMEKAQEDLANMEKQWHVPNKEEHAGKIMNQRFWAGTQRMYEQTFESLQEAEDS